MFFKPTEDELQQLIKLTREYDTRIEQAANEDEKEALHDECSKKLTAFFLEIDKRRLKKIIGNPDAILEDSKDQIRLAIFNAYEELVKYSKDKKEYMSFATGEARLISQLAADIAKDSISLYFDALKDNPEYLQRLLDLIAEIVKTSEYTDNQEVILTYEPQEEPVKDIPLLASIFNSSAIAFLNRAMNNMQPGSKKRGTSPRIVRKSSRNRHEEITISGDKQLTIIERRNKQSGEITRLEFENTKLVFGKNRAFPKTLAFSLQELCAQNFPAELDIDLQKMVDLGMYSNANSARVAVNNFFDRQLLIKIGGILKHGRKIIREECGVLFYHRSRRGNGHTVYSVNEKINMEFFAQFFTVLPSFAYALSENGFSLTWYIFYLARQNMKAIKENGSFNINLDTIREALGLPAVDAVKGRKYKQYIITPIMDAITEIMNGWEATKKGEEDNLEIVLHIKDNANIMEWLQGYIEVQLQGGLSAKFIEQAEKAEREQAKREKLKQEAQVRIAVKKAEKAAPADKEKR